MNNSCIDQGSMERNKASLEEHLLPYLAWDRGSLRICHLEESDWGWMHSIFLAYCHVALCTDCTARHWSECCMASWTQPLCLWYRKFCAWKSHPWNNSVTWENKESCHLFLIAPDCPSPAPELFPVQNCFFLLYLFSSTHPLLKEIHLLCTDTFTLSF